ncbi:MAG: acetate--CoA ligase family protein [Burkholderiales bacterium]|nr:acetate--CoA ligase family protein [Burkholderiales bacterium]
MSDPSFARALLAPRRIALVGASADPSKNTARPQRYLRAHGYGGEIVPINRNAEHCLGEKAYPSLDAAPEGIEHALIMVPGAQVLGVVEQCARKKIPMASIYSDGFAETGEAGRKLQDALVATARAGGVRLTGPNCMGIINTHMPCALSINAVLDIDRLIAGRVGLVSQSGSVMGALLSRGQARGVGFSKLVSVGNECDLSVGEIVEVLVGDADTDIILLFLETIRQPEHLAHAARRAYEAGKAIVVYKLGRSEVARELAASHTGAMTGSDDSANAFFRRHGIVRVDTLEAMIEAPQLLLRAKAPKGRRIAVLTTTGGGAAMVVDNLGRLGVEVVPPTDRIIETLAARNIRIGKGALTDLTMAGTRKETYSAVLGELLRSEHCDAVLAVVGSSSQFHPQLAVEPIVEAMPAPKPLAAFLVPDAARSLELLREAGVAAFRTPESCADALAAYFAWRAPQPPTAPQALEAAERLLDAAPGPQLNEYAACEVFDALGVAVARTQVIAAPADPVALRFPVVAKILSPDILHKTEAGGVAIGLATPEALERAAADILRRVQASRPQAKLDGILVQEMKTGRAEVILGYQHDPQVGPVVVLGVGGTFAEVYRDFCVRIAPVSVAEAGEMVEQVKGLAGVRGFRGQPKGDLDALKRAVAAFSQLAHIKGRRIAEAEINPLIVGAEGQGVAAVDGLVVLA